MTIIEQGIIQGGELIPTQEMSHRKAFGKCVRCFVLFNKATTRNQRVRIAKRIWEPMTILGEDEFSRSYEVASHFIKGRPYHEFLPK